MANTDNEGGSDDDDNWLVESQEMNQNMAAAVPDLSQSSTARSHIRSSTVSGIGLWLSWERNFTSTLLAALDLIDNAMDATMSTHSFLGKVHIYGDVDMQRDQITGLCIKNNCRYAPQDIEKVLGAYCSSKRNDIHAIGENGIGVKQACAAISDLSWVCIKNKKKIGLGVLAKGLQTETSLFLPSYSLHEDSLHDDLFKLIDQDEELRHCIKEYGDGQISDGKNRLLKHLQELSNWGGEPYVFLVVVDKCRRQADGPYPLMETLTKELPRHYLHVPVDFDVQVNEHPITFQYWERRLAELHKFSIKIDPINSWRTADDWVDPARFNEYNIYMGFDPNRPKDDLKASLLIHSRRSGRLIKRHPDARGILSLDAGGTMFAQGLTVILDDFQGRLPLTPTKQDLAFSNDGIHHAENLYQWLGALTHLYYTTFLDKYTSRSSKGQLSALVASVKSQVDKILSYPKIDKVLLLGDFSFMATQLPSGDLAGIPFVRFKTDKIRCIKRKDVFSIFRPDTLVSFDRPADAKPKAPTKLPAKKKRKRKDTFEEEKEPGGPRPGRNVEYSTSSSPPILTARQNRQSSGGTVATAMLEARLMKTDELLKEKTISMSQLLQEMKVLKNERQLYQEGEQVKRDECIQEGIAKHCSSKDQEIAILHKNIQQLKIVESDVVVELRESILKKESIIAQQLSTIKKLRSDFERLETEGKVKSFSNDVQETEEHREYAVLNNSESTHSTMRNSLIADNNLTSLHEIDDVNQQNGHDQSIDNHQNEKQLLLLQQDEAIMVPIRESQDYHSQEREILYMKNDLVASDLKLEQLEKELKDTKNQLEVALALKHELQISLKDMEADCNAARAQLQECLLDMNQRKSMNEEKKEGAEVEDCFQQDLDDTVELEKQVILLTAQVKYFRTKYEAEQEQKKQLEDLFKLNV